MYQLKQTRKFQKEPEEIEKRNQVKILEKIALLAKGREQEIDIKKLKGIENCYRLRCGKYRILYEKRAKEFLIIFISVRHRKKSYQ